jgi:serine phosphatase RsbU (regulator of sigma subunit)
VIGDVIGHDTRAAAQMGQLKSMLRVLTWMEDSSPASVLRRLDLAVLGLGLDVMATALVARLTRVPEEPDSVMALSWSSAGHPPPLLLHPSGEIEVIGVAGDMMLGVEHRVGRTDTHALLAPGARALLYTDGLVERRGESVDEGIARLVATLAECLRDGVDHAKLPEAVIDRMVGLAAEDDVAVLLVENPA